MAIAVAGPGTGLQFLEAPLLDGWNTQSLKG
jgi:hypothetical protein